MSNIPTYGLGGSSGNIVIYGYGNSTVLVPYIVPLTGSILGGDTFTIINAALSNQAHADTFIGSVLNVSKWVDISSGGTATVNDGLFLDVPSVGGSAGIRTSNTYKNFDVSARFQYDNLVEGSYPDSVIVFLRLSARIDANNNFTIEHIWDPTLGSSVRSTITVGGITSVLVRNSVKSSIRVLRLVRYGGRIQAYIGGSLIVDYRGWSDSLVNIEMVSSSIGTPFNLQTEVIEYLPSILVTFGDEICPAAQEVVDRIIGATPSTKLPISVEVQVHSISATSSLKTNTFEYFAPLQLTISNNNSSIVVSNDNTLRDSAVDLKGLRL